MGNIRSFCCNTQSSSSTSSSSSSNAGEETRVTPVQALVNTSSSSEYGATSLNLRTPTPSRKNPSPRARRRQESQPPPSFSDPQFQISSSSAASTARTATTSLAATTPLSATSSAPTTITTLAAAAAETKPPPTAAAASQPADVFNIITPDRITIVPECLLLPDVLAKSSVLEEYCAHEFKRLRSFILTNPNAEEDFKACIWSCIPWSAPGGKSGSTFFMTSNEQFILKQMTKVELQSFLSISQQYFKYVEERHNQKRPTLLSTILGIYKVEYTQAPGGPDSSAAAAGQQSQPALHPQHSSSSHSTAKYDLMVMQNLFFKRSIAQKFDLKGSTRNRLVNVDARDSTEAPERVLMDENLRREHSPLKISTASKQQLNLALDSDSKFLESMSVMDYSLLVGVDKLNNDLVLGIIDYVRPFTWDKKLEQVAKSLGCTELPTIVDPAAYRRRFCEAMDEYFEAVEF